MRIAILPDAYLPEGTLNHAKMMHELAVELSKRGHEVIVITPASTEQLVLIDRYELDGVDVWKFRCRPMRGVSHIKRAINETLLSWFAYRAIKKTGLDAKFDLIINYAPTIFFGPLVCWLKGKGAFVYLVLRDFFPQWAIDEGLIKRGSLVERYFRFFERLNYRQSNMIALQSPANLPVFDEITGPYEYPSEVLFNWASPVKQVDETFGKSFVESHGLANKFVFFYGGNIGHAQDIPYILRLAKAISGFADVHFVIVGQGDQFQMIADLISEYGLINTTLAPSVSQDEYRSLLTQVDVGLFTLARSHRAHNFPGKVLGYLAAGLPVLGAVNEGNDLIEVVNESGVGYVSVNGDFNCFKASALNLYHDHKARELMMSSSRRLLADKFSVVAAADQILKRQAEWDAKTCA